MELTRENILEILGNITEPDLKKDLVSSNLIESLDFTRNEINLTVLVSNPALHARKRMQEAVEFNLNRFFGESVKINCNDEAGNCAKQFSPINYNFDKCVKGYCTLNQNNSFVLFGGN